MKGHRPLVPVGVLGISLFLLLAACSERSPLATGRSSAADTVHVLVADVGAGLCTITKAPSITGPRYMIYDAGLPEHHCFEAVQEFMGNDTVVDLLVLSHPDNDHVGDADTILSAFTVRHIIRTGLKGNPRSAWPAADAAIQEEVSLGATVRNLSDTALVPGETLHLGDAVITLIAGWSEWTGPKYGATESNLVSIVLRLDYEGRSVLFTGDTGGRTGERDDEPPECMLAEELMVENSENVSIDSDVIIAPHHGANDGSSECFIAKVTPEYVIFPAGDRYGHPRKQTAARYLRSEPPPRAILRTDRGNDERNSDHWEQATCDDQKRDDDIDIILSKDTVFATYRSDHGACPTRVPPARPQPDTPTVP